MSKKSDAMLAFIQIYDKSRKKEQETVKSFMKELNKIKSICGTEWCKMYNQKLFNT